MAAKLKDLVNVNINRDTIEVQGVEIPVIFSMEAFPYVEEAYGASYVQYEKDLNDLLAKGSVELGNVELKIVSALIYGMVRAGGTETTPLELRGSIPLTDVPGVFKKVLDIFQNQIAQTDDIKKIQPPPSKNKKKRRKR